MNWGLKQGIMGRAQRAMSPSLAALGPNRYLQPSDFFVMLGLAALLHLTILGIAALIPHKKVTDIPVRALSFKIGGADRIAAYGDSAPIAASMPAPDMASAPLQQSWHASPVVPAPEVPKPLRPLPKPKPKIVPVVPPQQRSVPVENQLPQPAIAPQPQRFIREVGNVPIPLGTPTGAIGGQGSETILTAETVQQVRTRYEQQISAWIQQHMLAVPGGGSGNVVVRVRIDRSGYVRYYALEEASGNAILDAAAIDMIRRANPMPSVPPTYPAGNLIEFLIPINFGNTP